MSEMGKFLLISGIALAILGLIFLFGPKIPGLGKLPGDIYIKRDNITFYFPLGTCIVISVILTLILLFFRK